MAKEPSSTSLSQDLDTNNPQSFTESVQPPTVESDVPFSEDEPQPSNYIYHTCTLTTEAIQDETEHAYTPTMSIQTEATRNSLKSLLSSKADESESSSDLIESDIEFQERANQIVSDIVNSSPKAQGIVLLVHNRSAPESEKLTPIMGIEVGTKKLRDVFTNLGLAVVYLPNPQKALLCAIITVMSSSELLEYPTNYKNFIFYVTGHGADKWFYTEDGLISYNEVVKKFQEIKASKQFEQRFFYFDCCRSKPQPQSKKYDYIGHCQSKPEFNLGCNSRIVYATISGQQSWGENGVSYMTSGMINTLPGSNSMDEVFRDVTRSIPNSTEQTPTYHIAAKSDPALSSHQSRKMKGHLKFVCFSEDQWTVTFQLRVIPPLVCTPNISAFTGCDILGQPSVSSVQSSNCWKLLDSPSDKKESGEFKDKLKPLNIYLVRKVPVKWLNKRTNLKARVHYNTGLEISSNVICLDLTLPNFRRPSEIEVAINRSRESVPTVKISWVCKTLNNKLNSNLYITNYTVTAEYLNTDVSTSQTVALPFTEERRLECIFPFPELYSFGRSQKKLTVGVKAIRNDGQEICGCHNKEVDIRAVLIKRIDVKVTGRYTCKPALKIAWRQKKVDPIITSYTVHIMSNNDEEIVESVVVDSVPNRRDYCKIISVRNLFNYNTVSVQVNTNRQNGEDTNGKIQSHEIKKGLFQKITRYKTIPATLVFLLLALLILIIANVFSKELKPLTTKFTTADCVETSYGSMQQTAGGSFALCFEGWDVHSCDQHDVEKQLYCAAYSSDKLSSSRYDSFLTPKNNQTFNLSKICLSASRYALSSNRTSHNPNDAKVFYLLKDSTITIELCSNDDGNDNYTMNLVLLNHWVEVEYFLNFSSNFDKASIVVNKTIQYGEREGCKNYTIGAINISTFTYFTIEVSKQLASFKSLKGYIHQYHYNATKLGIVSERNKVGSEERVVAGDQSSTLICTAPDVTDFLELCEKASYSYDCIPFYVLTIVGAIILILLVTVPCVYCLCKQARTYGRRHGYSPLTSENSAGTV